MGVKMAIADPDPVFTAEISSEFKLINEVEVVWAKNTWDEINNCMSSQTPEVVLFGPGWSKARVLSGFKKFIAARPFLQAILVTADYSTDLRRQAAEAGFAGVFAIPIDSTELLLCVRRAAANRKRQGGDEKRPQGRFITVFSTKGGVGKTVVATNLAVALANEADANTVVVDLDLQFGDVGVMLKLLPKHTLHDLVGLESIDAEQAKSLLTPFNDKVNAFVAPLQPELADLMTPQIIKPAYTALRQITDYIIVDTPPCFNDNVLGVLDETDELFLVATLDLPSLKNIKLCLKTLKLLGFPKEKTSLILNRIDQGFGLSPIEAEAIFEEKIIGQIPNDSAVLLAVNKGTPVVLEAPKAPASKALLSLTGIVSDLVGNEKRRKKVRQSVSA